MIEEALHIDWRKPKRITKSFSSHTFTVACVLFSPPSFPFLFHLLFSLSLTLIISIFHFLNYTLLLVHLITTHFVSHLSVSSIIFIITDTSYQHLLLS